MIAAIINHTSIIYISKIKGNHTKKCNTKTEAINKETMKHIVLAPDKGQNS